MGAPVIESHRLTKHYGGVTAVAEADLILEPGEVVGFVGPNGAGKSTFMKMLLGIVRPTAGSGRVFGMDIARESVAIRRRVGYLPGDVGYYKNLSGGAFLEFCLSFHRGADRRRAAELCRRFELPLDKRVKGYSTGMRQKLALVQALAAGGDLLLLDEPTKGLDPTAQSDFATLLAEENARGRSILLSSHVLAEIERICHRIVFIDRGRLLDAAAVEAARRAFRNLVRVRVAPQAVEKLRAIPGVVEVRADGPAHLLKIAGDVAPVVERLFALGVESLEYNRPDLVAVYRSLYLGEGDP